MAFHSYRILELLSQWSAYAMLYSKPEVEVHLYLEPAHMQ
jgi:hypothetical protein